MNGSSGRHGLDARGDQRCPFPLHGAPADRLSTSRTFGYFDATCSDCADRARIALLWTLRDQLVAAALDGIPVEQAVSVLCRQVHWQGEDVAELLDELNLLPDQDPG